MSNASSGPDKGISALLLRLEQQLMDPAFRKDPVAVSTLLAEDFREFGSSGRVWSREAILDLLSTEPSQPAPEIEDFSIQPIAENMVLVTYRTVRLETQTIRSSIWIQSAAGWQMLFHQGTKVPGTKVPEA
jgi:hypothetical protein